MKFIAEIKMQSPFGFKSKHRWDELCDLAIKHGDIISVHTNPKWGGSFNDIRRVKNITNKPILAKGLHLHDWEVNMAFDCGAEFVLCVGRVPQYSKYIHRIFYEPLDMDELKNSIYMYNHLQSIHSLVWNQRDLFTGSVKTETIEDIMNLDYPYLGKICQASLISTKKDVHPDVDSFIVGEHLEKFVST